MHHDAIRAARLAAMAVTLAASLLTSCMTEKPAGEATITGTATYRERMALPPQAVFEAILEDVSRADAAAEVIGRTRIESPGNPPIHFSITYDPARIDPSHRYTVRARILMGDQLLFTTDQAQPVLGGGQWKHADLLLRRASGTAARDASNSSREAGTTRMTGLYTYMADAGWFIDCTTGQKLAVAQEGDNAELESAYLSARATPGQVLLATVEGRVEMREPMEGASRPTLIVDRFVSVVPEIKCPGDSQPVTSLENTYWKLTHLGSTRIPVADRQPEAHIILQPDQKRVAGSGGCNRIGGSYSLDGNRITFTQMVGTLMACPEGMEHERDFLNALGRAATWRIEGGRLELFDDAGQSLARFESRPQR